MSCNCLFGENGINLLQQKVAISLGYFMFSKNHDDPPKVAQLAKNHPIWSPWAQLEVLAMDKYLAYAV